MKALARIHDQRDLAEELDSDALAECPGCGNAPHVASQACFWHLGDPAEVTSDGVAIAAGWVRRYPSTAAALSALSASFEGTDAVKAELIGIVAESVAKIERAKGRLG